jgi:hypothetical protein
MSEVEDAMLPISRGCGALMKACPVIFLLMFGSLLTPLTYHARCEKVPGITVIAPPQQPDCQATSVY